MAGPAVGANNVVDCAETVRTDVRVCSRVRGLLVPPGQPHKIYDGETVRFVEGAGG